MIITKKVFYFLWQRHLVDKFQTSELNLKKKTNILLNLLNFISNVKCQVCKRKEVRYSLPAIYNPLLGIRNDLSVTIADGVGMIRMKYSILLINLALSFEIWTLN